MMTISILLIVGKLVMRFITIKAKCVMAAQDYSTSMNYLPSTCGGTMNYVRSMNYLPSTCGGTMNYVRDHQKMKYEMMTK